MSRIAFLPIDNRPVCYQLPQLIINQAKEHSLFLPDINLLGDLTQSANADGLINWLENLKNADIYIISLDTIAYGGLIPSRRSNDEFEIIKQRIDKLAKIIKNSNSKIFAFSSIMRISNNNINEEEKEYWNIWGKKIFEYSFQKHKSGEIKTDIPEHILNDYLQTRKRNFEINKYYIELKNQGIFDTLVFSKDDCSEFGLNVLEAEQLNELSKNNNGIFIKTGADEIPLTLLSPSINKSKNIKIYPEYTNPNSIYKISKYEDISVKKSVEEQIELSGGIISDKNSCDLVLIVNNFQSEQGELVMNVDIPLFDKELDLPQKPYLIADILNANGSDNNFVKQFLAENLDNFYGYAGWNTTGNTLGSVLSAALTFYKAKNPDITAFKELQIVRFLDDWAYQANIRKKIRSDVNNLSTSVLKENMKPYEKIVFNLSTRIANAR